MGKRKQKDGSLSRRDFLKKGVTVGVDATALAGLGTRNVEAQDVWTCRRMSSRWSRDRGTRGGHFGTRSRTSVIMVEENVDIGGHGMCSGGQVHLGGGTSNQRKHGVDDSADQVFLDWVRHDHSESRYSDRDLVRVFADENAATFEFLIENGVQFQDHLTGPGSASTAGASTVRRQQRTI